MNIKTIGDLRALLEQFPDDTPIQAGYAAGTMSGEIEKVDWHADAEFEGVRIYID